MAVTTQELYLSLYTSALGGLGDSVGRTTTPITEIQAADFAANMADAAMIKLKAIGVTETSDALATSTEASSPTIKPVIKPPPSIFENME